MTDHPRKSAENPRGRPFEPGNPGKPKGTRHRATMMAEKLMADDAESVVRSVIDAAKAGDMVAARLVLERLVPIRKGRPVEIALPPVETPADILAALSAVVGAMAAGDITPEEATTVTAVLEGQRKAVETVEIERRLSALEKATGAKR